MGGIRKQRKKYKRPMKIWDKQRIIEEHSLKQQYGLKNMKEIWIAKSFVRKKRKIARELLAHEPEVREKKGKELLDSLARLGMISKNSTLEDVLSLDVKDVLERRLQTVVFRKGLARTIRQARQLIVHGHISINGTRVTEPSYLVKKEEESLIDYYKPEIKEKIFASIEEAKKQISNANKEEKQASDVNESENNENVNAEKVEEVKGGQ